MSALTDTFTAIANKIRAKLGVQTTYTPAEMPDGIDAVYSKGVSDTKVGTAAAGDVLSGKTFTNSSSVGVNGSMTNKGSTGFTITNTSAVTIPAGYYNGSGKIQTSGMMVTPTATKSITANGSNIDVLNYAKANVNVSLTYSVQSMRTIYSTNADSTDIPFAGKYIIFVVRAPFSSTPWTISGDSNLTSITLLWSKNIQRSDAGCEWGICCYYAVTKGQSWINLGENKSVVSTSLSIGFVSEILLGP